MSPARERYISAILSRFWFFLASARNTVKVLSRLTARCNGSCYKRGRKQKKAPGARPTIHCRRSLQGPWHGPSGTQPSSAIVSALPTIALATSAPIYLHLCSQTGARRPRCACLQPRYAVKHSCTKSSPRRHSVHATECREGENPV